MAGGESLLHAPSWNQYVRFGVSLTRPVLESVSSFRRWELSLICLVVRRGGGGGGVYLTRPVLPLVLSFGECGVSITCPLQESVSSCVGCGISLTRPVLVCLVYGLLFVAHSMMEPVNSFGGWVDSLKRPVLKSVSSFVGWGVSLTRPVLDTVWSFVG